VLVELLDDLGLPAWLSYSIEGTRTRAGQPLEDAFAVAARSTAVVAVGINCCAPGDVQTAVEIAVEVTGKPAVAYPNSGEAWDAANHRWTGDGSDSRWTSNGPDSPALILGWTAAGARFVGGCCRVGPPDIAALAATLAEATR